MTKFAQARRFPGRRVSRTSAAAVKPTGLVEHDAVPERGRLSDPAQPAASSENIAEARDLREHATALLQSAGVEGQRADAVVALLDEVKRQEIKRLRAEASQLQRELGDVEVGKLREENERLKVENLRLREANKCIAQKARKSIEEANRLSAAAWEAAAAAATDGESASARESSIASLHERSSLASLPEGFEGCDATESLDMRIANADAATPAHSMSLLRQMAENNRKLKLQLAM